MTKSLKEILGSLSEEDRAVVERSLSGENDLDQTFIEQKKTEIAFRESELCYKLLVENAPVGIHEIDLDGRLISMNRAGLKMMGINNRSDIQGLQYLDIVVDEDRGRIEAFLNRAYEGHPSEFQFKAQSNGRQFIFDSNFDPVKDSDDNIVKLMGVTQDITKRKGDEKELYLSEKRYRTLLESSPVCIKIIDLDSRLQYMSPAGVKGLKIKDIKSFYGCPYPPDFFPESMRIPFAEHLQRSMEGKICSFECLIPDMDGCEVWYNTTFVPARDDDGQIEYIIASSMNINDRKRMEMEFLKTQKLESVGVLAGGIAHDFNNILTIIIGNISVVKRGLKPNEKSFSQLTRAENAGHQAQKLTQKLLTFASGGEPVKKAVSTRQLLRETVDFALSGSKVSSHFTVPEEINPLDGDYGQISQVIQNLIINADQAMPNGGVIRIQAENVTITNDNEMLLNGGNYVKISIADQGTGIAVGDQQKIFDPFFTKKQKGSGLGLATVYSIIHNHSGYITLESSMGILYLSSSFSCGYRCFYGK